MHKELSACLIVKDEEQLIEKCLRSIKKHVNEIIVIDTGSSDNTVELAKKYADKVLHFDWVNDFSAARNYSIKCAKHDWVVIMDADNEVVRWNEDTVGRFIEKDSPNQVGNIEIISTFGDSSDKKKNFERENMLFNRKYFQYEGIIHEQVTALDGNRFDRVDVDIAYSHYGYEEDEIKRKNKAERNITLLKKALNQKGDDCYLLYQLGKSYDLEKDYKSALEYYEKAIAIIDNYNYVYVRKLIIAYGYILINAKEFKSAMIIEKYRDYYLGSPDYNFLLGYIYMMNAMPNKAIETFIKCTQQKDGEIEGVTSWLPLYNIGVIYECYGLRDKAIEIYHKCGDYKKAKTRIAALTAGAAHN